MYRRLEAHGRSSESKGTVGYEKLQASQNEGPAVSLLEGSWDLISNYLACGIINEVASHESSSRGIMQRR